MQRVQGKQLILGHSAKAAPKTQKTVKNLKKGVDFRLWGVVL